MSLDDVIPAFIGISFAILCLTELIVFVKGMRLYVRMVNADPTIYSKLCSFRLFLRPLAERQALLHKLYEKDPGIERLYTSFLKWFAWPPIIWIGWFIIVILFAIQYAIVRAAVASWLRVH